MQQGFFDYDEQRFSNIADAIMSEIADNDRIVDYEFGYTHSFCDETILKFIEAVRMLREAKVYVHRIDVLLSGDENEKTFLRRLNKDLEKSRTAHDEYCSKKVK